MGEFMCFACDLGLPPWATKFIEMVLMLTADHGPAVSGCVLFHSMIGLAN
jgi:hypothetical protein